MLEGSRFQQAQPIAGTHEPTIRARCHFMQEWIHDNAILNQLSVMNMMSFY